MVLFCAGCSAPKQVGPRQAGNWAYAPHQVEIHPLSRFRTPVNPEEELMIVVHVEFTDGDGFSCRGMGQLSVTITGANGKILGTELVNLEDQDENRLRFDPVTRTYRVRFTDVNAEYARVTAQATFTAMNEKPIRSKSHAIKNNK